MRTPTRRLTGRLLAALAAAAAVASTGLLVSPAAQAAQPGVINGTPNPPLAGMAVYYETADSSCTGSLLLPNLVVTAAHCLVDDAGNLVTQPSDLTFWAPGVNVAQNDPAAAKATSIIVNPGFHNRDNQTGIDVAFFVLDQPLGTPVITRVATQSEVVALLAAKAVLSQVGYGLTVPRADPNGVVSDIPIGMSASMDGDYAGGIGEVLMATNGVTGTCAGDSGSPWVYQGNGQVLLVSVLSSGDNPPCEPAGEDSGTHDYTAVVSGQGDLLAQAQQAAGQAPAKTQTTCLKAKGSKPTCAEGTTWTYDFCWDASRYRVEQQAGGSWKPIASGKAKKYAPCGKRTPYRIVTSGTATPGSSSFRLVIPRQPGIGRVTYDPFTVTSS